MIDRRSLAGRRAVTRGVFMGMKSEARRSLAGRCRRIGVALACLLGAQALPATAAAPGDCAALRTLDIPNVEIRIAKVVERSEEHTSELQSLMRISYAVFCLKKKNNN